MTVRRGRGERSRALLIALALGTPLLLAGCATPRTHFDWGVKQSTARKAPVRHTAPKRETRVAQTCPPCNCDVAAAPAPTPRPTPAWYKPNTAPASNTADVTPASANGDGSFSWPMQGRILSNYGSKAGGGRNDGINIAASQGDPIRAAADGVVSYSGNDLKSYGNLTLIKHDNGYVTAYAHAERFVVGRGDHVARGQVIGYVGETGDVRAPQLHFEIRRGVKPVNPNSLLGSARYASR